MAAIAYNNAKVLYDGYDVSGDANSAALHLMTDIQERTTFVSGGYKQRIQTLGDSNVNLAGLWLGPVDKSLYGQLTSTNGALLSFAPTGAVGTTSYFVNSLGATYEPLSGKVGDVAKFSFTAQGNGTVHRGTILENGIKTTTGTGGTGQALGAVGSTQVLYAGLHVVAASGTTPTFNAVIESAGDGTFTSPVTRITFAQATTTGSQQLSIAGPITDTQFRLNWTLGGTTPSFTIFLTLAIA
jgi:myo-inositol-hexaphosphate 3-phosphohydrolase